MNEYFIGTDLGLFEGDIRSLCVAHLEDDVIVIDNVFQTRDETEFEKKIDELYEKYKFESVTPAILPSNKQIRTLNFVNLLKNKKIELTSDDLKYFQ